MRVIFLPEVHDYLDSLIPILYEKEYFGFEDAAVKYIDELVDDIMINLPVKLKKVAPKHFTDQFGKGLYYAAFRKNKRTQWYAFFIIYQMDGETYYQIRHIENNHTAAQYL